MAIIVARKRILLPELNGKLEFFEREASPPLPDYLALRGYTVRPGPWRKVLDAENIVLNGFYNDLIAAMQGVAITLAVNGLILGTSNAAVARTQTALTTEWTSGANTTPQRLALTATAFNTADPPQGTWSFYLPAAANTVSFAFAEAGMMYSLSSFTPGNTAQTKLATRALFAYTKNTNTDLRIDYTLARSLT